MSENEYPESERRPLHSTMLTPSIPLPVDYEMDDVLQRPKFHHLTVCMVPPESSLLVWEMVTKCRTELRDPGLFRWPPHVNLLYPFLDIQPERISVTKDTAEKSCTETMDTNDGDEVKSKQHDDDDNDDATGIHSTVHFKILKGFAAACAQCEPFRVRLQRFGTFGGRHRGVLWLHPDSYHDPTSTTYNDEASSGGTSEEFKTAEPLVKLQSLLVQAFPTCSDQNIKSSAGIFQPHMTVSHFASLDQALEARKRIETWWPTAESSSSPTVDASDDTLSFPVDCIYLLQRKGDSSQFLRVADIPLGRVHVDSATTAVSKSIVIHDPPVPFRHMPTVEEDWVLDERMQLKQRRNGGGGGNRGRRNGKNRGARRDNPNRIPDSPDVVEAKRAARKAKREGREINDNETT